MYIRQFSLKPFYNVLSYALYCMPFLYSFGNTLLANCGLGVEGIVAQAASCGLNDGKASLILNGGVAPLSYAWSNGATTATATGLAAGFYTVTVTDANACAIVKTVNVSNINAPLLANTLATAASCQATNGAYDFSVLGATTYDIAWSGTASGSQTAISGAATIPNLASGDYNLIITANGCSTYSNFTIGNTGNISILNTVVQAPTCNAGTNGILRATAMAGSLPFEFFLNGVSSGQVFSNNFDFSALSAGVYEIVVKDGNGCLSLPVNAILNEAGSSALNNNQFVFSNASCAGTFTAAINLATGNTGTYELYTSNGTLVGTLPQTALGAGEYEIRSNTANCISFLPVRITEPTAWQLSSNIENTTCVAGNSTLTLQVTGGTAPYTYAWSNGATSATLTNLYPDFYTVSITDANACTFVSNPILVQNCSSTETATVLTGGTITHCVDTMDIAGNVFSVLNICGPSNTLGTINSIGNDGCINYTAGTVVGIETICIQVCNADASSCDTTTIEINIASPIDTIAQTVLLNNTITACPDLTVFPSAVASVTDLTTNALVYGTITIDQSTGCVTYAAGSVMGRDTVSIAVCDVQGFCDTTIMVFTTQSPATTVTHTVSATTEGTYCPDLSMFANNVASVADLACSVLSNGSLNNINTANGCIRYQAGNWVATDTICIVVCDTRGFCDTTTVVFSIVPNPDTVVIDLVPGAAAVDTCLYNIQFTTPVATVTDLACATVAFGTSNLNTTTGCINYTPPIPLPGAGTRSDTICVMACDANGVCDTVTYIFNNIEPTCGGTVPDTISRQVIDCNAVSVDVCLPIPLDSLASYQVYLNGTAYTGATAGCAFVTKVQYPFVLVPTCNNDFIISWVVNGQTFGPAQVTGVNGVVNQLTTWDATTTWAVNNNIITGINPGNDTIVYGNLTVTCLNAGTAPTILGAATQQQYADGTQISLNAIGHYSLTVVDRFGCVDTALLRVECVNPSYEIDTVFLDSTIVNCTIDYTQIQTALTTVIACSPTGNVAASIDSNGCLQIEGLVIGTDSLCVVACDEFGICDTTYFTIQVMLPQPIAVTDSAIVQFATASVDIDLCANDTIPNAAYDIRIITNPSLGSLTNNGCVWTYTRRSGDVCGIDSFQYEISNATSTSTAWVYVNVECLPFSISEGISPNGDGYNDRFIINNLADYPNHELFIFNRWGKMVFNATNYANDWEGTYKGDFLPDGTYFYILEMNNDRDEVFKGFFIIKR